MPGFKWIYLEGDGVQHHVELFHGRLKGHVLITCNNDILFTDFNVRQSKTYTFFINQELCKIHLKRSGFKFVYTFEIDKKADTPLNKMRKKRDTKYNLYTVLIMVCLAIPVYLAIVFNKKVKAELDGRGQQEKNRLLSSNDLVYGVGKIFRVEDKYIMQAIVQGVIYELEVPQTITEVGWPVEKGQEYDVQMRNNEVKINWNSPSKATLNTFKDKVMEKLDYNLFSKYGFDNPTCLDELVMSYTTAFGLASFYHSKSSDQDNPHANSKTFEMLLNSEGMKNTYKEICDNTL